MKVIIVAAKGKHFSAGHDVRECDHLETQDRYTPIGNSNQHPRPGVEGRMPREEELYTGLSEPLAQSAQGDDRRRSRQVRLGRFAALLAVEYHHR